MNQEAKTSRIRSLYLYVFAGVGLFLVILGVLDISQTMLRAYVFPVDDSAIYANALNEKDYVLPEEPVAPVHRELKEGETLTEQEQVAFDELMRSYETLHAEWQIRANEITGLRDKRVAEIQQIRDTNQKNDRNRVFAVAVAQSFVGLFIFGYHWWIIQEELAEEKGLAKRAKKE